MLYFPQFEEAFNKEKDIIQGNQCIQNERIPIGGDEQTSFENGEKVVISGNINEEHYSLKRKRTLSDLMNNYFIQEIQISQRVLCLKLSFDLFC